MIFLFQRIDTVVQNKQRRGIHTGHIKNVRERYHEPSAEFHCIGYNVLSKERKSVVKRQIMNCSFNISKICLAVASRHSLHRWARIDSSSIQKHRRRNYNREHDMVELDIGGPYWSEKSFSIKKVLRL